MAYLGFERRSNRRVDVPATASLVRAGAATDRFIVANLSAAGALLIGDSELGRGDSALLRLESPDCEPVYVHARVVRGGDGDGVNALAVEFRHRSPDTEGTALPGPARREARRADRQGQGLLFREL